jgi:hypothetical protein
MDAEIDLDWKSVVEVLGDPDNIIKSKNSSEIDDARLKELPTGLWNRCRIWTIVERVALEISENPERKLRSSTDYLD